MRSAALGSVVWLVAGLGACHPAVDAPAPTPSPPKVESTPPSAPESWVGSITTTFAIPCFAPGLVQDGKPATCELSAVTTLDAEAVAFNDKPIDGPERSAALRFDPRSPSTPIYLDGATFAQFRKYEDAAALPGGEVLVTTGFDRIRDDAQWDPFNALFVWVPGRPVRLLAASTRDGIRSSRTLRDALQRALADETTPDGPPYFKVEGLAVTAEGEVLIGIREAGRTYEDFSYRVTILVSASVDALDAGKIDHGWDGDPEPDGLTHPLGLSSLGQDHARGGTWLTTSYEKGETDEALGGYLWWLSDEARRAGAPAVLVRDAAGEPLHFAHKPEGVTVLDGDHLLVVHDDDRVTGRPAEQISDPTRQFARGLHESFAQIVAVSGS